MKLVVQSENDTIVIISLTDGSISGVVYLARELLRVGDGRDDSRISNFRKKLGSRSSAPAHFRRRIPGDPCHPFKLT